MPKKPLALAPPRTEGLGEATIMSRALAVKHGARYVHAAAVAIDVERVFEIADDSDEAAWPEGWELLLVGAALAHLLDPAHETDRELVEDLVADVFERLEEDEGQPLGAQCVFGVYDLVARGAWPASLEPQFAHWKKRPKAMLRDLAKLHALGPDLVARLARACLAAPLDPPLAPPVREVLGALATEARPA